MKKLTATFCLLAFVVSPFSAFAISEDTSDTPSAQTDATLETSATPSANSEDEEISASTSTTLPPEEELVPSTVTEESAALDEDAGAGAEDEDEDEDEDESAALENTVQTDAASSTETAQEDSTADTTAETVPEKVIKRSPTLVRDLETADYDGVIVKYKSKKDLEDVVEKENAKRTGDKELEVAGVADDLDIALVKSKDNDVLEMISDLENEETIEAVEPNFSRTFSFLPNDALFSQQWGHRNNGQNINGVAGVNDADIDGDLAWDLESSSASEVIVAVIDSGVNYAHADLDDNMWDGTGCVDDLNVAIAGGCPYHGWDYAGAGDNDPMDELGHGTFVTSVIASESNNGSGTSGMSRHNKIKIMALRFDFDLFSEIKAIHFAGNNGAKVINASFGGPGYSQLEKDAIDAFPGVFVAAAGNGGADSIGDNMDTAPEYPCAYTSTNLICVAASDQNDQLASFSNYGPTAVDIAAPGVNIIGLYQDSGIWNYFYGNGTSFSAPFVAGAAGLLYGQTPSASRTTVRARILQYANRVALSNKIGGNRRLNVYGSLTQQAIDRLAPIYRFYSRKYQSHLYTASESEKDNIITNWPTDIWAYQRVEFLAYDNTASGVSPVYRFWSRKYRTLYYTTSVSERDAIIRNWPNDTWEYQGPRLYVYLNSSTDRIPVYRMWSKKYKASYFTTNTKQRDCMIKKYPDYIWRYEGVSWWVPKEGLDNSIINKC